MTDWNCTPRRAAATARRIVALAALTGVGGVWAQAGAPDTRLHGDWTYGRGSGSGGYASNTLGGSLELGALPLTLGLDAMQSFTDAQETSTQFSTSLAWKVSPLWSVTPRLSTYNDAMSSIQSRGFSVAWQLHRLWNGSRSTRLEWTRELASYALQSGALVGRLPQQTHTRLEVRQEITPDWLLYADWDGYDYSVDPTDLARVLLARNARRLGVASRLGDMQDNARTVGANVILGPRWSADFAWTQSATVVGQNQRQWTLGLTWLWQPRAALMLTYTDGHSDAVSTPSGLPLSPAQNDTTVDLGVRWQF